MAGKVVTIAQQKGGAGKTTLAAHLAAIWSQSGLAVAAVDIDPQGSFSLWTDIRARARPDSGLGFAFARLSGWRLPHELDRLSREHDVVVVDSAPHAQSDSRIAIRYSHLVVVPVQPSPMDLWATQPTLDVAKAERRAALLVVNRMPPRSLLAEDVARKLAASETPVANIVLGNRTAYASSLGQGLGVTEAEPGSTAAQEMTRLASEIAGYAGVTR
ncbi:MAG: AAA family ATPase [Alphaproteobacteria bacterium]|nr:AAA family ATPase [Alphaproteobacteria bacterium]